MLQLRSIDMYCPKCGKNLPDTAKFCSNCGYRVNDTEEEKTKEINVSTIKEVEQNPNYSFVPKKEIKNNNSLIITTCVVIILLLIVILLLLPDKKKEYLFEEDKVTYCNDNSESSICEEEEEETEEEFDSMDFSNYDFSETSSSQSFYESVLTILKEKEEDGNKYCNNEKYALASKNLDSNLQLNYSYLCGMDVEYLTNLANRLSLFYKINNLKDNIVDAYVVGEGSRNEYANYTIKVIGSNTSYAAYLRRVQMSIHMFSDYDKLKKTYQRDLDAGFHPKNSVAEDIIVHETAHALDFYISAMKYDVQKIVIEDFTKYNELSSIWGQQTYAKEVIQKAVERVNKNNSEKKTEEQLRQEISGYAATTQSGTVMYCETFAEALVDYLTNGNNASPLSIEVYKIVQEDLANL